MLNFDCIQNVKIQWAWVVSTMNDSVGMALAGSADTHVVKWKILQTFSKIFFVPIYMDLIHSQGSWLCPPYSPRVPPPTRKVSSHGPPKTRFELQLPPHLIFRSCPDLPLRIIEQILIFFESIRNKFCSSCCIVPKVEIKSDFWQVGGHFLDTFKRPPLTRPPPSFSWNRQQEGSS